MRSSNSLIPAVLLAGGIAMPAQALTCYLVFDRTENVIYRDVYPPVDLSDAGRAQREAMRARGEFLLFLESDQCPRIEYFTGSAGTVSLRLEDTLAPTAQPTPEPAKPTPARTPRKPAAKGG